MLLSHLRRFRLILPAMVLLLVPVLHAGSIPFGIWQEFSFNGPGQPVTGCDPADPVGSFCIGSSGTPSSFLDAPPWTFTVSGAGALLTVTDAFLSGDRFELFNGTASLGLTSVPLADVDCGDDPAVCAATAGMSTGRIQLAGGSYSLTITQTAGDIGSGYLLLSEVPEPGSLALCGIATSFASAYLLLSRRRLEVKQ